MTAKLQDRLAYAPRGLRAERAAAYVGLGRTKFLELVEERRMPRPFSIDGAVLWDRHDLDAAIDAAKDKERVNSFDMILGSGGGK